MRIEQLSRISGVLLIGVFAINAYIGADDKILQSAPPHLYTNWALAAISLVAALLLFLKPKNMIMIGIAGVIWPILYVGSLAFDVATTLCFGLSNSFCWSSKTTAFDYLILNETNIPGQQGWTLVQGVVPIAIVLLFVAFILSLYSIFQIRKQKKMQMGPPQPPVTGPSPTAPPP